MRVLLLLPLASIPPPRTRCRKVASAVAYCESCKKPRDRFAYCGLFKFHEEYASWYSSGGLSFQPAKKSAIGEAWMLMSVQPPSSWPGGDPYLNPCPP